MNKSESKYYNTSKKMNDALISLLEKKDFDYISIKDICKEANVNRSTFYLHYDNTSDLLEEVVNGLTDSFSEFFKGKKIDVNDTPKEDLYLIKDEYLLPYLSFIEKNRKVYKAMKNNLNLFQVNKTYKYLYENIFSPILTKYNNNKQYHHYIMDFYIHGLSALILDWCEEECKTDKNVICSLIKGMIPGQNE